MSYLFYIDEKNNAILHPDCVKLEPMFAELSEKEMLYIILAYDYHSMYRQFPERDRIRRAMFHVFGELRPKMEKDDKILLAIEKYRGLQYDPTIELTNKFQKRIEAELSKLDEDGGSTTAAKNSLALISELRAQMRNIQNEVIEKTLEKGKIKGDKTISFLEELKKNKKLYDSVTAPK